MQAKYLCCLVIALCFGCSFGLDGQRPIRNENVKVRMEYDPFNVENEDLMKASFMQFIAGYNKSYGEAEYAQRFQIFKDNLKRIPALNQESLDAARKQQGNSSSLELIAARYGITKFMDLSPEEFRSFYLLPNYDRKVARQPKAATLSTNATTNPTSQNCWNGNQFDWNFCDMVTKVYNQGQCGSCWAFSVTEQLESMWALAGHSLPHLAMQQLVDCVTACDGCGGGYTSKAWEYIQSVGGEDALSSYPYTAEDGYCHFKKQDVVADIQSWVWVTQAGDEEQMYNYLVNTGPMSVCVDASKWQYYEDGVVLAGTCGKQLDHCVQLTGIDNDVLKSNYQAWDVRNSWGGDWGVGGYLWIQTGSDVCGIAQDVTSAVI